MSQARTHARPFFAGSGTVVEWRISCTTVEVVRQGIWKASWHPIVLACAALGVSAISLKMMPTPFAWAGLAWAGAFLAAIFCLRKPWPRALALVFFDVGALALVVASTEIYFSLSEERDPIQIEYSSGYLKKDDILGTVPTKGAVGHARKRRGTQLIYDVNYTIDSNGLRVAPPTNRERSSGCILFFGDSFTFGEGLQDHETLPYRVGVQSEGRYETFNFGFHGYGPHQMLAALEHGIVRRDVSCRPDYAVYQAIPDHVARVAGKVSFERHGPRYQLDSKGQVHFAGHFDDVGQAPWPPIPRLWEQLDKSAIYRRIGDVESAGASVSDDDIRLFLAVMRRSRDLLKQEYPDLRLDVILWIDWDGERSLYEKLQRGLRQDGMAVHLVEDILPGYTTGPSKYVLSTYDRHPSALANEMLARYVLANIVGSESE